MPQPRVQRHGAALRKARQHNGAGGDAARHFVGNQRFYRQRRVVDARSVFAAYQIGPQNVVPGGHDVAIVQADRNAGRMWKDEADRRAAGQVKLGHQSGKVIAVCAQAVQPDDGSARVGGAFNSDVGQEGCHGRCG